MTRSESQPTDKNIGLHRPRLSNYFVYDAYEVDNYLFFNRGSIGFVMEGWCLVGTDLRAQGEIADFLKRPDMLKEGDSLEVLMVGRDKVSSQLGAWVSARKGDIYTSLATARKEHLEKLGTLKDHRILISFARPSLSHSSKDLSDIQEVREQLKGTFKSIGLPLLDVTEKGLMSFVADVFDEESAYLSPHESLSEQILPLDFEMEITSERLNLKTKGVTHPSDKSPSSKLPSGLPPRDLFLKSIVTLEPRRRPDQWSLFQMDLFLGDHMRRGERIDGEYLLYTGIQILPNQGRQKLKAIGKREALERNLKMGILKWVPGLQEEHTDMQAACNLLQEDDRLINLFQTVVLKDKTQRLAETAQQFKAQMRRHGFEFQNCIHDHLPMLLSVLPMALTEKGSGTRGRLDGLGFSLRKLGHGIKTVSSEAQALMPLLGEWKGMIDSPGMLLEGRRGQLMQWSPWGGALTGQGTPQNNFNLCIAGTPGSGKSVFMQELMLSALGVGAKVFVLDYGRSFKRTAEILGGEYIEFDIRHPCSLNPFSEIPMGEDMQAFEAREDALSGIAAILPTMAAPKEGTTDEENAFLQKALRSVFQEKGRETEITDLAHWLEATGKETGQRLATMLFPFTREGLYGAFFTGKASVSFNKDIVVIETDHLRNVPNLMTVLVQMIIVHINNAMARGSRTRPNLIMIDEAWKLLQGKESGAFIEEITRIARKYNGSLALATQQLSDYFRPESPAAEKAFENSSWKAILMQNANALHALRQNPKLSAYVKEDWQLELLMSIHSNPPHYSEAALFSETVHGVVGRLRLDPFTLLMTSTNARDYEEIEAKTNAGMPLEKAIQEILAERGQA
jgi:conjugal transfer ATP-binding protein TraC